MNLNLKTALDSVNLLSTLEKIQLMQKITQQIESELKMKMSKPRKPLRGLWKGLDIKDEEILQARKEMWDNFPREDI
ncbi:MAG: hypothetical protein AB7S75_01280 [Desulfococcaceae bacterium]